MTKNKNEIFSAITCAIIFTLLFHLQGLGLNIFLIEMLIMGMILISKKMDLRLKNHQLFGSGVVITAAAIVISYSIYAIIINLLAVFIFVGILIYPQAKSLGTAIQLSFYNIPGAQYIFVNQFSGLFFREGKRQSKFRAIRIFVIPLLILFFFIAIYRGSSPFFDRLMGNISSFFGDIFSGLFENLDLLILFTFLIGLLISNFIFLRISKNHIAEEDASATNELIRNKERKPKAFRWNALKEEYKAGIFLLLLLNLTLMIVNVLDIYWVWFNFSWNGQYLKQFVHEGTYLLILSILCSIAIVLYFFRGNLNFYNKNNFLRTLSYIWIAQNAVLTISVAIRNFHYISFFALAYKRIGLLLFLILTLYGLYTVYRKVSDCNSSFYLFRKNLFAMYVVLVLSSLINWGNFIAKYNFNNASHSFVEFSYLTTFPDKSLPYLDKSEAELKTIKAMQKTMFPFEEFDMSKENYKHVIEKKKTAFTKRWESQSFLSWNLPEYLAYEKLKE